MAAQPRTAGPTSSWNWSHGVPITKYCDDNHLTPRERLKLFVPVCQAIQHAHQKGIIHRDIKPSNVMVTLYDGKPVPKVIDFGVAKAYYSLGLAFGQTGKMDEALASHRKAVEVDSKFAEAYMTLGILLGSRKNLNEAAACFRKVVELQPTNATAHNQLGAAHYRAGEWKLAIAPSLGVTGPSATATVNVTGIDGTSYAADLAIEVAATISGRLTRADGQLITAGSVRIRENGTVLSEVRANSLGDYSFALLRGGTFVLEAFADGASFLPLGPLTLAAGESLTHNFTAGSSSVHADVAAADGARAVLYQVTAQGSNLVAIAKVDGGGVNFANLAAGDYTLTLRGADNTSGRVSFTLAANSAQELMVSLAADGSLSGVALADNLPLQGATVVLMDPADVSRRFLALTDRNGAYQIKHVSHGTYDLVVFAAGQAPLVQRGVAISGVPYRTYCSSLLPRTLPAG
jgi:hypothetical protein